MRILKAPPRILVAVVATGLPSASYAAKCAGPDAIGISREIIIPSPIGAKPVALKSGRGIKLRRKELVLTIDDGPHPRYTPAILKTLKKYCLKATFFMVGEMASQSPHLVREVYRQGHTVATHTWGHPRSLPKLKSKIAMAEINRGIEAVADALKTAPGSPSPAPLFRFPGLNASPKLISKLNAMGISAITLDIDPRDWEHKNAKKLLTSTLKKIRRGGRGVLLLHDIKPATAAMLPALLRSLKKKGYKFVHLKAGKPPQPPMLIARARKSVLPAPRQISFKEIGLRPSITTEDAVENQPLPENKNGQEIFFDIPEKAGI